MDVWSCFWNDTRLFRLHKLKKPLILLFLIGFIGLTCLIIIGNICNYLHFENSMIFPNYASYQSLKSHFPYSVNQVYQYPKLDTQKIKKIKKTLFRLIFGSTHTHTHIQIQPKKKKLKSFFCCCLLCDARIQFIGHINHKNRT